MCAVTISRKNKAHGENQMALDSYTDEDQAFLSRRQRKAARKNPNRQHIQTQHKPEPKGLHLKSIVPITENQRDVFYQYASDKHLLLLGSAGTGKTFLSFFLALSDVAKEEEYERVVVIRSAVQSRDQGFLPGSVAEKSKVYELPYQAICTELYNRGDAYSILKGKGQIEFITTSFVRGITLKNCIVIVDEIQNLSGPELNAVMTRVGENCKIIFCGDFKQSDLTKEQERMGLKSFVKVIDKLDQFATINFTRNDIVRSKLVKDFIIACEDLNIVL